MPEAPEIEIIRRKIENELKDYKINKLIFIDGPGFKKIPSLYNKFKNNIIDDEKYFKLVDITRRGKFISFEFEFGNDDNKKTWWICNNFGLHGIYRLDDNVLVPNYDTGKKKQHIKEIY